MITDLNEILVEWAYRTNDGKPDVKSNAKLLTLEGVLKDFGWSREARAELLNTLMETDIVKNKDSGNIYTVQNVNKDKHVLVKKDASDAEIAKVTKDKVDKEKDDKEPEDKQKRIINGKDKTLKKVNTSDTETFSQGIEPDDDDYSNDLEIGEPPPKFEIPEELNKGKFPKKYAKLISRMMNSKRVGTKPEISTLISKGGAGAISAQAGEVLTLMATSTSDRDWETYLY